MASQTHLLVGAASAVVCLGLRAGYGACCCCFCSGCWYWSIFVRLCWQRWGLFSSASSCSLTIWGSRLVYCCVIGGIHLEYEVKVMEFLQVGFLIAPPPFRTRMPGNQHLDSTSSVVYVESNALTMITTATMAITYLVTCVSIRGRGLAFRCRCLGCLFPWGWLLLLLLLTSYSTALPWCSCLHLGNVIRRGLSCVVTVATVFLKVKEVSVKCIDFKFLHRQSLQPVSQLKATTNACVLNRSCLGILLLHYIYRVWE